MRRDTLFSVFSLRKRRAVLQAPVLLRIEEHRRDLVRWTMGTALIGLLALLLTAPPGGWTVELVSRSLGGLAFVLGFVALLWMLFVSPHPLYITEAGVAKWPFVCRRWDELEYYAILNIGINRPIMALQLLSKRSTLPVLPATGVRLTEEDVRRARQIMAQKGVPEYPD